MMRVIPSTASLRDYRNACVFSVYYIISVETVCVWITNPHIADIVKPHHYSYLVGKIFCSQVFVHYLQMSLQMYELRSATSVRDGDKLSLHSTDIIAERILA